MSVAAFRALVCCRSGIGKHIEYKSDVSLAELVSHRKVKNRKLIASQKEDTQSFKHLMQACRDDAALGRMDPPQLIGPHHMDVGSATFSPRFGVEQGRLACSATLAQGRCFRPAFFYVSVRCQGGWLTESAPDRRHDKVSPRSGCNPHGMCSEGLFAHQVGLQRCHGARREARVRDSGPSAEGDARDSAILV